MDAQNLEPASSASSWNRAAASTSFQSNEERTDPAEILHDAHGREEASRPGVRTGFPHTLEKLILKRLARPGPGLSLQRARESAAYPARVSLAKPRSALASYMAA